MVQFAVNTYRFDPYKGMNFRLKKWMAAMSRAYRNLGAEAIDPRVSRTAKAAII